jgi:hypothetical protein
MYFVGETPLLYVLWEAVAETESSQILLGKPGTAREKNSSVFLAGKNLLASNMVQGTATLNAQVRIDDPSGSMKGLRLVKETMETRRAINHAGKNVALNLIVPEGNMVPGELFVVEVTLDNPDNMGIDLVSLGIRFDPAQLEVLDWDNLNWIRQGVNVFDGHAHAQYPFNIHWRNEVLNARGKIFYRKGLTEPMALASGSLIQIRCRAKQPNAARSFDLFALGDSDKWRTDVSDRGMSVLARPQAEDGKLAQAGNRPR